jgi:uncharacterized paraquat-inducible protein A
LREQGDGRPWRILSERDETPVASESVVAEVEAFRGLLAQRVFEECLSALTAEVETKRSRDIVLEHLKILFIDSLKKFLHIVKMIEVITFTAGIVAVVNALKDVDLQDVARFAAGVDWPLTHVAGVMKHERLRKEHERRTLRDDSGRCRRCHHSLRL